MRKPKPTIVAEKLIGQHVRPTGVYNIAHLWRALGLTKSTLIREIRLRRLRAARRAGQTFILGEWLLEWLRAGEVQRRELSASHGASDRALHPENGHPM